MLPSSIRFDLRARPDFFLDPQVIKTKHLTLLTQSEPDSNLRAAIVVKKAFGGAVERAKIRRILRSALIAVWKEQPTLFQPSLALVILPRGPLVSQSVYLQELREVLLRLSAA